MIKNWLLNRKKKKLMEELEIAREQGGKVRENLRDTRNQFVDETVERLASDMVDELMAKMTTEKIEENGGEERARKILMAECREMFYLKMESEGIGRKM